MFRHGADLPRNAAVVFEVISWITVAVCLLAGLVFASQGGPGVIVGITVVLSGFVSAALFRAIAIAMRWMAAMYELASRGFEPEESLERPHRRAA
ncbi:hypothetical protein [Paractinoplanes rishiriensis]|uniref:Uncharacterized protein n=1 Tax=Paractinoplanes rishiriensis TaxID=1050105 RepID=A0A919MPA5_9ACTN|nr:hypothetical protein [Actinoplanes rishiriensis]GIE94881.1 hypothetical protein Ari01nite_23460 [Actinoplanes rishiriensis]